MPKIRYSEKGLAGDRDWIPIEDPEIYKEYEVLKRWKNCKKKSFYQAIDTISPAWKQKLDAMCLPLDEEMRKFAEKLGIAAEKYCLDNKSWMTCQMYRKEAIIQNKSIKEIIENEFIDKTVVKYASNEP
eukprot:TRINITY_DN45003_c0_g1_i1.p3 TRINITY_DN45003_c0_g1~~TRINITY_DN45003_c0_g1_i1.p3  ORF type:complete len:147 (-),score=31.25 TRINITY_DN45003_c0_g1_i1:181-567(-)